MEEQSKETSSSPTKRRTVRVPPKRGQIKVRIFKSLVEKAKELASMMASAKQSRGGCSCCCSRSGKLASVTSLEDT
ncbi:Protein kinase domain-containing protein [Psidium guajava]|nr:Protein kinase domain-containing protein [Psidium guajava]